MKCHRKLKHLVIITLLGIAPLAISGCAILGVVGQVAQGVVAALGVVRAVTTVAAAPLTGSVRANLAPVPLAPGPLTGTS